MKEVKGHQSLTEERLEPGLEALGLSCFILNIRPQGLQAPTTSPLPETVTLH